MCNLDLLCYVQPVSLGQSSSIVLIQNRGRKRFLPRKISVSEHIEFDSASPLLLIFHDETSRTSYRTCLIRVEVLNPFLGFSSCTNCLSWTIGFLCSTGFLNGSRTTGFRTMLTHAWLMNFKIPFKNLQFQISKFPNYNSKFPNFYRKNSKLSFPNFNKLPVYLR